METHPTPPSQRSQDHPIHFLELMLVITVLLHLLILITMEIMIWLWVKEMEIYSILKILEPYPIPPSQRSQDHPTHFMRLMLVIGEYYANLYYFSNGRCFRENPCSSNGLCSDN